MIIAVKHRVTLMMEAKIIVPYDLQVDGRRSGFLGSCDQILVVFGA